MDADAAFRWLGTGGFAFEEPGFARALTYRIGGIKFIAQWFSGTKGSWAISKNNAFKLNLVGASRDQFAILREGRIQSIKSYSREGHVLPLTGVYGVLFSALQAESDARTVVGLSAQRCVEARIVPNRDHAYVAVLESLEALITEGWIRASTNKKRPFLDLEIPEEVGAMHRNRDNAKVT